MQDTSRQSGLSATFERDAFDWRATTARLLGEERPSSAQVEGVRRRLTRLTIQFYGATAAYLSQTGQEVLPLLDNCEQLPNDSVRTLDVVPTHGDLDHVTDAADAIRAARLNRPEVHAEVAQLVMAGEVAQARALATCRTRSIQLECPSLAGGCGSSDNYVPAHCDNRLCEHCMLRRMGALINQYEWTVKSWSNPTLLTVTIPNSPDFARDKQAIQGAFGRLRRRRIQPSGTGTVVDDDGNTEEQSWVWRRDGGEPARYYWKSQMLDGSNHDRVRRLQDKYVDQGKAIPLSELITSGFYGIDIKQVGENEYNTHLHALVDMEFVPKAALADVWNDLVGQGTVDVRRIDRRGDAGAESALAEVVGYVCKPPEFNDVESRVHYVTALKGSRMVQPFGQLHGNTPDLDGTLTCAHCEESPAFWNYKGYVSHPHDNMGRGSAPGGENDPPGAA